VCAIDLFPKRKEYPVPAASSPTEEFHRLLMNEPTAATQPGSFPPYCVAGSASIPDVGRWGGDVNAVMNRLQTLRRSFKTSPPAVFQSVKQSGMLGQRQRLLASSGQAPAAPPGRTAGGLTNQIFVGQALDRYWAGTKSAGKPTTSLARAIHGSFLADIYTVTGRYMREITRNRGLRTDNDCALFPLYRSLHFAAADVFGQIYGIDGSEIDIYLQKQLIGLVDHGETVDELARQNGFLVVLSDQESLAYRLQIKDGKFWIRNGHGGLDLFDCSGEDFKENDAGGYVNSAYLGAEANDDKAVAGFAMGLNRDIYAAFHTRRHIPRGMFFHSAYMASREVLCTGCITVVEGRLTYINNASGHYQPNEQQLALAVQALRSQGVDISRLKVQRFNAARENFWPAESAPDFLKTQQGAGFTKSGADYDTIAKKIRAALVAYQTRAGKWWSRQSDNSRAALNLLRDIPDDRELVEHAKFLLGDSERSPIGNSAPGSRIKTDGELAKQLKKCFF